MSQKKKCLCPIKSRLMLFILSRCIQVWSSFFGQVERFHGHRASTHCLSGPLNPVDYLIVWVNTEMFIWIHSSRYWRYRLFWLKVEIDWKQGNTFWVISTILLCKVFRRTQRGSVLIHILIREVINDYKALVDCSRLVPWPKGVHF